MRRFGLIGYPLSHSFSQTYFTEKFAREGIQDCLYENFPLPDIARLREVIARNPELEGLNVTIPYKKQVIPFLDDRSQLPIEACNCIRISSGRLTGFNTDIIGFEQSLRKKLSSAHRSALILGKGGAGEAVEFVLRKLGISFTRVRRRPGQEGECSYEDLNPGMVRTHTLIVNATPLGMYPKTDDCPAIPYEAIGPEHYLFDLIYNPPLTLFLKKGAERGATIENGLEMLKIQAEESWKIWNAPRT